MSRRAAARLAWGLWLVTVALSGVAAVFGLLNHSFALVTVVVAAFAFLTFSTVGALVASRHAGNAIGWLFCCAPLLMMGANATGEYARYAHSHSWPGVGAAGWMGQWSWAVGIGLTGSFLLLLFPDGHLPSPRWRPVAWLAGASITLAFLGFAFGAGPLDSPLQSVDNPLGIPGAKVLLGPGMIGLGVATLAAAVSLVVRFRHAGATQRQQLKWFVTAASATVLFFLAEAVSGATIPAALPLLALASVPVSVGVAILQYRLYEIDRVINRTLVYGALTATLAVAYLGSVLLLQELLSGLTRGSELAVAGSTLAVAALFRPARTRIQDGVDRRFYRRKYDAARTLEAFSTRLRDEVDLDSLSAELRAVVGETMQPAHVSLWLREAPARRS